MISKRKFVGLAGSALISLPFTEVVSADVNGQTSLKSIASKKGIEIATAYNGENDSAVQGLISHHCDTVTPENALKARELFPHGPELPSVQRMDELVQFCQQAGLNVHGHTLFWHQSFPEWLDHADFSNSIQAHNKLIEFVCQRYPDIASYDVVNEPLSDSHFGYRRFSQLATRGDAFLDHLFKHTRLHAPQAKLVINDYNLSCSRDFCARKRDSLLFALEQLLNRNAPIDAVGLQAHLLPKLPFNERTLSSFISAIDSLGLSVYISELDVNDIGLADKEAERDRQIADIYGEYLELVLGHKCVKRLGFWGLSDRYHWIVWGYAPFKRKSGVPRPALFDKDLNPKQSYFAVLRALENAPVRP